MKWLWLMLAAACTVNAQAQVPRSGFEFMSRALQTMQLDDTQNPGMLWLKEGEQAWAAGADKSCASCHGAASTSMRGGLRCNAAMSQFCGRLKITMRF